MPFGGPRSRRVYIKCLLVCVAGGALCLVAAFVILALQSPRFGMDQPWFDKALSVLKALLLFFGLFTLALKFLAQISDSPGDPSE
jgi:NADH:ubiquinone oxidoreductase subunit 4 (subunit M)